MRESRERVRAAIVNCGFEFPLKRITASLAPADLRKAGPGFDLAIAAAILFASGQVADERLTGVWLAGELALDGSIRSPAGRAGDGGTGRGRGRRTDRGRHGQCGRGSPGRGDRGARARLAQPTWRALARGELLAGAAADRPPPSRPPLPDLADLRGQPGLRHGLEVAAAGGHGMLVIGPPGAGKSLAARRLALDPAAALEAARRSR